MSNEKFHIENDKISEICKKHYVRTLSVFGSALHGDSTEQSDVDILVEFESGHTPGFSFISLQDDLSDALHRKVDLHTPQSLSEYFRNSVVKEAQPLYGTTQK